VKYAFYPGCTWESAAGYKESVYAVNKIFGIELDEISDWNCCGATASLSLDENRALLLGARVMALAEKQGYDHIVTGCNACYTTLRKVQKKLVENEIALGAVNTDLKKEKLSCDPDISIRHHLEILVNDIAESTWTSLVKTDFSKIRVAGYYGCQLRSTGFQHCESQCWNPVLRSCS